jgi:transcription elongation factor Elf1
VIDENAALRVYTCPLCGVDAPHTVFGERNNTFAIVCTNCRNGSLVCGQELDSHQMRWEEELKEILDTLDQPCE